jgi:type I restriction enzyme S subunit
MGTEVISDTECKITGAAVASSSTNIIPAGNVVIATRVGLGKVCRLAQDTAINQDLRGVVPIDPAGLSVRFLFWWLKSVADDIVSEGTGATVQGVRLPFVRALRIPLPPIPEQHRVVAILEEAFEGIAVATANAEKNLENARAAFEDHLQSIFTQRGDGWAERRLDEVALEFGRGRSRHRPRNDPKLYGGKWPFIQTGDIRGARHVITAHTQTYNDAGLSQSRLWPSGTVCITIAANIAESGVLAFDACFPDSVIGLVPDERLTSGAFVEYMLQSFRMHLQALGKGSAQANINLGTFASQRFPFPDLSQQREIVATLDELRHGTERLESVYQRKLDAFEELRQSFLHSAFGGHV